MQKLAEMFAQLPDKLFTHGADIKKHYKICVESLARCLGE